jgi:hypothetical protein
VITPEQLGADEDLAREVLIIGRDIAPCLDSFPDDSEDQKNALAILRRVYTDLAMRGSMFVKGQSIGPARVEYAAINSAFAGQPRRALRALCGTASGGGLPLGSFPLPARVISHMWPEDPC